jgi:hypothetical protein
LSSCLRDCIFVSAQRKERNEPKKKRKAEEADALAMTSLLLQPGEATYTFMNEMSVG